MPRPPKSRQVHRPPRFTSFKPTGIPSVHLEAVPLTLDEYEAIRLADHEGLDHAAAAKRMEISRSTFSRLVERARHRVARLLVEGCHLQVEGGAVHFRGNLLRCCACRKHFPAELDTAPGDCPECGSDDLEDLAVGHGHRGCCRRSGGRGRARPTGPTNHPNPSPEDPPPEGEP